MNTRFVLIRRGCEFCHMAVRAVHLLNKYLDDFKKIQVFDNFEWEEFSFKAHPIMDKLDPKNFDGYPFIYIDGIEVGPAPTELLIIDIGKILEEDLIMPLNVGRVELG